MADSKFKKIAGLAKETAMTLVARAPELSNAPPGLIDQQVWSKIRTEKISTEELAKSIAATEELGLLRHGWLQSPGRGQRLAPDTMARALVQLAVAKHSVPRILNHLRRIAQTERTSSNTYYAITGLTVSNPVRLTQRISLLPWSFLPGHIDRNGYEEPTALGSNAYEFQRPFATAILRVRFPSYRVVFPNPVSNEAAGLPSSQILRDLEADVIHCLTSLGIAQSAILGSFSDFDDVFFRSLVMNGWSFRPALFELGLRAASIKPVHVETDNGLSKLLARWNRLRADDMRILRIALARLNRATRRFNFVESALDLGIALEVLLLHEVGGERGELKFRTALRGARFIGGPKATRLKNLKVLKNAYDLRSIAAHTGSLPEKIGSRPIGEILSEAATLCARIAERLIKRGRFPDWDTDYLLGGAVADFALRHTAKHRTTKHKRG